jgi:hypothetical protein
MTYHLNISEPSTKDSLCRVIDMEKKVQFPVILKIGIILATAKRSGKLTFLRN